MRPAAPYANQRELSYLQVRALHPEFGHAFALLVFVRRLEGQKNSKRRKPMTKKTAKPIKNSKKLATVKPLAKQLTATRNLQVRSLRVS